MSYRRFSDVNGSSWEAWEVHPTAVERRVNADRRAQPRHEPDRRHNREFRLVIPRELADGWMRLSDVELVELVARTATGGAEERRRST